MKICPAFSVGCEATDILDVRNWFTDDFQCSLAICYLLRFRCWKQMIQEKMAVMGRVYFSGAGLMLPYYLYLFHLCPFTHSARSNFSKNYMPSPRILRICTWLLYKNSQNVVLEPATSASPGHLLDTQILRPTADRLSQERGRAGGVVCVEAGLGEQSVFQQLSR